MNSGWETIEWLYNEQLQVDPEWSIRSANGFTWWADQNAQTIQISEGRSPDGKPGYLVSIRTEFLREIALDDKSAVVINALLTPFASMAGPVYDASSQALDLCSLVEVHQGNSKWVKPLLSIAAVLQIAEARIIAPELARVLRAKPAITGHPQNGLRSEPDEMAEAVATLIAPLGQQPSRWESEEFQDTVDRYIQLPPALLAHAGDRALTVEFPYGDESSLCEVMGKQAHPKYGNGLFLLQSFPVPDYSDADGAKLALSLNATELTEKPTGYGFGSYCYRKRTMHFTSFFPNVAYHGGMLANIYFSSAQRARGMSVRLMESDWTPEAYNPKRSAVGRMFDRFLGR